MEECNSLDESVENLDRNSLASFGSGNTTDSDKVSFHVMLFYLKDWLGINLIRFSWETEIFITFKVIYKNNNYNCTRYRVN